MINTLDEELQPQLVDMYLKYQSPRQLPGPVPRWPYAACRPLGPPT